MFVNCSAQCQSLLSTGIFCNMDENNKLLQNRVSVTSTNQTLRLFFGLTGGRRAAANERRTFPGCHDSSASDVTFSYRPFILFIVKSVFWLSGSFATSSSCSFSFLLLSSLLPFYDDAGPFPVAIEVSGNLLGLVDCFSLNFNLYSIFLESPDNMPPHRCSVVDMAYIKRCLKLTVKY